MDVVIPVWNAPAETRRCVDALYRHAGSRLGRVRIEDDASEPETARMLDALDLPGLEVHHAPQNRGFGASVNEGVAATRSASVLVLNSDAELEEGALELLLEALERDPGLAAVNPTAEDFARLALARYEFCAGCVRTFNLKGFAFLMRRKAFDEVGGFDARFERGYYEDRALSRELVAAGWRLGIRPESRVRHAGNTSFGALPEFDAIVRRNRALYYRLYPEAMRRVALVSDERELEALPSAAHEALEEVLRSGGRVRWFRPGRPRRLISPEMDARPLRPRQVLRLLGQGRVRLRWSGIWLAGELPVAWRATLCGLGTLRRLDTRVWRSDAAAPDKPA